MRIEGRNRNEPAFDLLEEQARLGEQITAEQIADKLKDYLGHPAQLPYITRVVEAAVPEFRTSFRRDRVLSSRIQEPLLLELIWSYWHEEGMLMQTINAVSHRFQNIRRPMDRDPQRQSNRICAVGRCRTIPNRPLAICLRERTAKT